METNTSGSTGSYDHLSDQRLIIMLPIHNPKHRFGQRAYPDIPKKEKTKHNRLIATAARLLESYKNGEGINALVLDGKEMRTTKMLQSILGSLLNTVYITEYNLSTYDIQKNNCPKNVKPFHCHIEDFVDEVPEAKFVNVAYFDITCNFRDTQNSNGSESVIRKFLEKSKMKEIVLAATFCMRSSDPRPYEEQKKFILDTLCQIFENNNFGFKPLLHEKEMMYKGQQAGNKGMMFCAFILRRNGDNHKENESFVKNGK